MEVDFYGPMEAISSADPAPGPMWPCLMPPSRWNLMPPSRWNPIPSADLQANSSLDGPLHWPLEADIPLPSPSLTPSHPDRSITHPTYPALRVQIKPASPPLSFEINLSCTSPRVDVRPLLQVSSRLNICRPPARGVRAGQRAFWVGGCGAGRVMAYELLLWSGSGCSFGTRLCTSFFLSD